MAGVSVRAASDAPKLVCRRSREPKTRRLFDSSEPRDVSEPVLLCWRRFLYGRDDGQGGFGFGFGGGGVDTEFGLAENSGLSS